MGYYDRNYDLKLELAREKYRAERAAGTTTQSHTESAEETRQRVNSIERMLIERRAKGDYLPEPGDIIEHRSSKSKGVGRLLDYDLIKGELVAVCLPERESRKQPALLITRVNDLFKTNKNLSDITIR